MSKKPLDKFKVGETVYICDYRLNRDHDARPIRHVKPTKVMIVSNNELPKNKTVYYSEYHFRPFNKNGTLSTRVIAPFDNTGYRSYTGICVNIFKTLDECTKCFVAQCNEVANGYKETLAYYTEKYTEEINSALYEAAVAGIK